LINEGIDENSIELTGHIIVDVINENYKNKKTGVLKKYNLVENEFCILTFHRQENTDNIENVRNIIQALGRISYKIIFPIHPRTKKRLAEYGLLDDVLKMKNVIVIDPIGYLEILELIENAKFILTDSGGMQQEAFILKTLCITLRYNTEWYETLELGCNFLVGTNTEAIVKAVKNIVKNYDKIKKNFEGENPFGRGNATKKMIETIKKLGGSNSLKKKSLNMIVEGYPGRE
jgi:UDP-N-acetylglucosamine 2-epimerase